MKKIIILAISLSTIFTNVTAQADLTIVTSSLEGEATELPNGVLQIYSPRIRVGKKSYQIHTTNNSRKMWDLACGLVNKKYVYHTAAIIETWYNTEARIYELPVVLTFRGETVEPAAVEDVFKGPQYWTFVIKTLTCK